MGNRTDMVNNTETKAGQTLTDQAIKFTVAGRAFAITGMKLGTLIRMSTIATTLEQINGKVEATPALMQSVGNMRPVCHLLAMGITNQKPAWWNLKARWKERQLTDYLLWNLNANEILQLASVVLKQMNSEAFFFTMQLISGSNILKSATAPVEGKPSGEALEA